MIRTLHEDLKNFTFEEFTRIVKDLLEVRDDLYVTSKFTQEEQKFLAHYSEEEFENIINQADLTARVVKREGVVSRRVFNDKKLNRALED